MVMTALAWNLKAWYGLLMPNRPGLGDREDGVSALPSRHRFASGAEYGRRIVYRLLSWNELFFPSWEAAIDGPGSRKS